MNYRPYALLAELTYRCPLHCPYCSNPTRYPNAELTTDEWRRVFAEAAELGVLQVGLSGGEPLQRQDLTDIVGSARQSGLYTNLITSGLGLNRRRVVELGHAGLDSVQISFQADEPTLADRIAGAKAHHLKVAAAEAVRSANLAFSANVVLHRHNIDRIGEIIESIHALGAERLELANTQFYGWAFLNRATLLPTRQQTQTARDIAAAAKQRLAGRMEIFYVLPDYFETRPKPCLNGWGMRYLTVNAGGEVLPCPTASSIPDMHFDSVRVQSLAWIWKESESFNRFRGTDWMPSPCRECPQREIDFGGCRCQAALLTGNGSNTDPVCELSPHRFAVDNAIAAVHGSTDWQWRVNPSV